MIILTTEEAARVRGLSPKDPYARIEPILLKDGTYMLGEEVLEDTKHDDLIEILSNLPRKDLKELPIYTEEDLFDPPKFEVKVRDEFSRSGQISTDKDISRK
jgi:hypothetical protein